MLFACDLKPPIKAPPRKMIAPKADPESVRRRFSDGASADTGALQDGSDLVRSVRYNPEKPTAYDDIEVEVDLAKSPGTRIDVDYAWYVNGRKLLSARDDSLLHRHFEKGDQVQVILTIEANDQTAEMPAPLLIIANTPPRILTKPNTLTRLDGFRIRAEDPDGGRVRYSVKGAPEGLAVGETTGVFRYVQSADAEGGSYDLRIIVTDEDEGESEWRLQINIKGGSKSKSEVERRKAATAKAEAEADAEAAKAAKAAKAAEAADAEE